MLVAKIPVLAWLEKTLYGLLILCLGGVGSLTYFDAFSPDHPHPYHLSILHKTPSDHIHPHHCHSQQPGQATNRWQVERLAISPHPFATELMSPNQNIASGLVRFFQSGLSQGYLLTVAKFDILVGNPLSNRVSMITLTEPSVWLPPPEKPPPSLSLG